MAKKTRRARATSRPAPVRPAAGETQRETMPAPTTAVARPKPASAAVARVMTMDQAKEAFRQEYRYVISDLRTTGILAGALFATMVILALILG